MQDGAEFYSTDENQNITLNQLLHTFDFDDTMKVTHFAVIDLDQDGTPEVVLNCGARGIDYYTVVLRYQDGTVYGYTCVYRMFNQLKTDGTFSFSSSAAESGFGTASFTTAVFLTNMIAYSLSDTDSSGNMTISYFVNQASATEDEFNTAIQQQVAKTDVTWYDFTTANIESVLSGS